VDKHVIFIKVEEQIKDIMMGSSNNYYKAQQMLIEYTTLTQNEVRSIIDGWKGGLPNWIEEHVRDASFVKKIKTDEERFDISKFNLKPSHGVVVYDAQRAKYVGDVNKKIPSRVRVISENTIDKEYLIKKQKEIKEEARRQMLAQADKNAYNPKMKYESTVVEKKEDMLGRDILLKNKMMQEHRDLINKFWEDNNE